MDNPQRERRVTARMAADAKVKKAADTTSKAKTPILRRSVLDAAAALFAERGFGGTNLQDVADALGMSRPGLYYHFASKEKLLEALIEEVTLSAEHKLQEIVVETDRDPEDALRLVVKMSTEWVLDNHVLFRVLDRSEVDMPPELTASHAQSKRTILEYFTRIIERGIALGKFRPVDPHIAALTIVGMRNWAAWWYTPGGRLPGQMVVEAIAEMAVRSLLRPDAHRSRSDRIDDALRILKEDVAHLSQLITD